MAGAADKPCGLASSSLKAILTVTTHPLTTSSPEELLCCQMPEVKQTVMDRQREQSQFRRNYFTGKMYLSKCYWNRFKIKNPGDKS